MATKPIKISCKMPYEVDFLPYQVSTDPQRLDIDMIHQFLSEESYWSRHIPRATVEAFIPHSLCFGVYHQDHQIGFARLITDYSTFAYMADVFIIKAYRAKGLGKFLVQSMMQHPKMQGIRRWLLFTADAHGLYEQYGFGALPRVGRAMAKVNFEEYPLPD